MVGGRHAEGVAVVCRALGDGTGGLADVESGEVRGTRRDEEEGGGCQLCSEEEGNELHFEVCCGIGVERYMIGLRILNERDGFLTWF